jgi:nitrile hydratase
MNSIHDMGGMDGLGPLEIEANEPVFHADWERRVFGMVMTTRCGTERFRHAIERMPPADYLRTSYFEHWLHGVETALIEIGTLNEDEIAIRMEELKAAD